MAEIRENSSWSVKVEVAEDLDEAVANKYRRGFQFQPLLLD